VTRIRAKSITIELIILFVAVIGGAELLSLSYRYADRSEALTALETIRIADRIAGVVSLVERTAPKDRQKLLETFRGSELPAAWTAERWPINDKEQNKEARLLRDLLLRVLPGSNDTDVIVSYLPSSSSKPPQGEGDLAMVWRKAGPFPEPIRQIIDELTAEPTFLVTVRLKDGTWLNLLAAYVENIDFWPLRSIVILAAMIILITALSIWAIARLTSPFQVFAAAARRLGTDVNAKPIPEQGPEDVRGAIRAFNDMQTRLQRFIEDRTQMLAAVSHDLRTPITRLRLRAEYIASQRQRGRFLADLEEMDKMISSILSFAKEDTRSESTVIVDLRAMLRSLCDDLSDRGSEVSFGGEGRLPFLCRPLSLRRCLTNLLDNALKYGGRADVSIEFSANAILIHFDDNGPGIPEALRDEAFRPFTRLEESRNRETGGSGLGLTVARTLARAHGGDIVLSEAPNGGLRATVVLPNTETRLPAQPSRLAAE
jgi:signal transduction histidine kinase